MLDWKMLFAELAFAASAVALGVLASHLLYDALILAGYTPPFVE